jgi:catechol 2,3-dioxygenase-like lactoylglutathione lyase family enzyme
MDLPQLPVVAFDHVGIATPDPDCPLAALLADTAAVADDESASAGLVSRGRAMKSGVTVARFGPGRSLELVWPGQSSTPIHTFLERRGPGLHHIALRVDEPLVDLHGRLLAAGIEVVGGVDVSSDGRPCLFLHPRSTGGVLVELVEGGRPDG